jgi:DMSO/TMAO reductase YedYZ heme-binding membrane subunit
MKSLFKEKREQEHKNISACICVFSVCVCVFVWLLFGGLLRSRTATSLFNIPIEHSCHIFFFSFLILSKMKTKEISYYSIL